jgi:hypothetical protein
MESSTHAGQKAANVNMSADPADPDPASPAAGSNDTAADEEKPSPERSRELGEGLGVFRALILMFLFYLAAGWIVWIAWAAFQHWRSQ